MTPQASQPSMWVPARIWLRRLRGTAVWQAPQASPRSGTTTVVVREFHSRSYRMSSVRSTAAALCWRAWRATSRSGSSCRCASSRRARPPPRGARRAGRGGDLPFGLELPLRFLEAGPLAALVLLQRGQPLLGFLERRLLLLVGLGGLDPIALLARQHRAGQVHFGHEGLDFAGGADLLDP